MKPTLGVVLSDTTFVRPPGDVGSSASYSLPVMFHVARGVTAAEMVRPVPNAALLDAYLDGALALQKRGAHVVTTTCGFLVSLQDKIAARLDVPFVASSLLQIPLVSRLTGGRIGIITANDEALTRAHLAAAGIAESVSVGIRGLQDDREFADPLLRGIGEIDVPRVERCVVRAGRQMLLEWPDIRAFVCECHNLPPFSAALQAETGRPVYDILSLAGMALQGWDRPVFSKAQAMS